jgi:hypothetical protein
MYLSPGLSYIPFGKKSKKVRDLKKLEKKEIVFILYNAGRKVVAVSFIWLILVANFWFILRVTNKPFPEWSERMFMMGVLGVVIGFFLMIPRWINPSKSLAETDEDLDDSNR